MISPFTGQGYTLAPLPRGSTSVALTPSQSAAARAASAVKQALWKRLVTKILVMLDHVFQQTSLRLWFGVENYKRMFEDDLFPVVPTRELQFRFIDNEIVGLQLDPLFPSLSRAIVNANYCTHPTPFMQRRGHPDRTRRVAHVKGIRRKPYIPGVDITPGLEPPLPEPDYSWMCGLCAMRWQRYPATHIRPYAGSLGPPEHNEIVSFGRYAGNTFAEVLKDPDYCRWVTYTAEVGDISPAMLRFALYVGANQHQMDVTRG